MTTTTISPCEAWRRSQASSFQADQPSLDISADYYDEATSPSPVTQSSKENFESYLLAGANREGGYFSSRSQRKRQYQMTKMMTDEVPEDELLVLHKFKTEDIDNVLNNLNNVIQKIKANRHLYEKSGGVSINQLLDDNVQSDQPAPQISPSSTEVSSAPETEFPQAQLKTEQVISAQNKVRRQPQRRVRPSGEGRIASVEGSRMQMAAGGQRRDRKQHGLLWLYDLFQQKS